MCNLEIVEEEMSVHIDRIFPTLLKTLSDSNDEVVILALRVLSVICKPSPGEKKHFSLFMVCTKVFDYPSYPLVLILILLS